VAGIKVMVKVIYCGHSLQAEAELNRQGEWIGQCVVGGSAFTRTIMLYTPLRTPTAALDAMLTAGRRWIDEQPCTESTVRRLPPTEGESQ
jgi:hypothetical protein